MKKTKKLLSIILSICMLLSITAGIDFSAYAASVDIYFDNYYYEFDNVYVEGRTVVNSNWVTYEMEDIGDGIMKATVTKTVELLRIQANGGYASTEKSEYKPDVRFMSYGWSMPSTGTIFVPDESENMGSEIGGKWLNYSSYSRTVINDSYDKNIESYNSQGNFNENASDLKSLFIDGEDIIETNNTKGIGWEFRDGILYIGEKATFNKSIKATGDLTIIHNGAKSKLNSLYVSGNLCLSSMCGILDIGCISVGLDTTINISSYSKINFVFRESSVNTRNVVINGRKNSRLELCPTGSGGNTAITCDNCVINCEDNEFICLYSGGGGDNYFVYAENNIVINGAGIFGDRIGMFAEGDIINNGKVSSIDHMLHIPTDWIEIQTKSSSKSGIKIRRCKLCGSVVDSKIYCSHNIVIDEQVASTCISTGLTEGSHCVDCGEILVEQTQTPLAEHKYIDNTILATCTEQGYTLHICELCNESFNDNYTTALGHDIVDTVVVPTCTAQGYTNHKCSRCSYSYKDTYISAKGHTTVEDKAVEATCTKDGLTAGTHCSVCGMVFIEQQVVPAAHNWNNGVITKRATCENAGEMVYTCNICGKTETEAISALGHDWAAATCTAPKTCNTCGATDGAPLGHSFGENNATCAVCGVANPNYVAPTQPTTQAPTTTTTAAAESTTKKPKATSIKKLTKGKKSFKATWKKISGVSGYQVQYATDKKFKKNTKAVTIKKNTASATVKKLKANKKYYVRVRAYKTYNGKNYYSAWSTVKTVTTKK